MEFPDLHDDPGNLASDAERVPLTPSLPNHAENPVFSGWDVVKVALAMLISPVVMMIPVALLGHALFARQMEWHVFLLKPMVSIAAELAGWILLLFFMRVLIEGKYHKDFWDAVHWSKPIRFWPLVALGIVLMFVLQGIAHFLPIPKEVPFDQFFQTRPDAIVVSLFAVSLGPLIEELFFRGFLYPVLARRLGMVASIAITSVLFAGLHAVQLAFSWSAVLVIFLVGLTLTTVRAYSRSVASSFVVHASYNATLMALSLIATDGFRHMEKLNR